MAFFSFGKKSKRRVQRRKGPKKPPAALLKKCRKHRIKTTMKKGGRKVYRKVSVLKKLLARKMRKVSHKKVHRRRTVRRRGMGFGSSMGSAFTQPANYGYDQKVQQYPQLLSQSSQVSNAQMNLSRPEGMGLAEAELPVYGVYRNFFGQDVPTQLPANYNFMGQPDGTLFPVGAPFQSYKKPIASFGKKKRYIKSNKSACSLLKSKECKASPMCSYVKYRGCRRRPARNNSLPAYVSGDEPLGEYAEAAGITFFGKKKRYNVAGSACNKLTKKTCSSNPNCSYTKRGCKRRKGTATKGMVYEGPSLPAAYTLFGKKKRYNVAGSACNKLTKKTCSSNPNCSYTKRGCKRRKGTATKGMVYEGPSLPAAYTRYGGRRTLFGW